MAKPWVERGLAFAVAMLTFAVYLVTIYPGLFGMGDAAKFSFVGKVLGTPHAPGYPMYVMVSHLFSYVPWGTLAFRMNVLSALLGALAVFLLYFAARALGTRPAVAASAALACGLGRAFWSKAQYAKGYTLTAALVCAGVLLLLRWSQTGRRSLFYWAIAVFALSIGNHLIVVSLVPALVLHALLTNRPVALAPRTLIVTLALVALGFSQYSLILIRTWQQAPYLEARAETVGELVDVVTARRYAYEIGAFSMADVLNTRVPAVARLVSREMTWPGLAFAAIGIIWLMRRRARDAILCLGGAAGVIALTINMSSNEDEGFLLSAFVLLWLLAAAGLEALWSLSRSRLAMAAVLIITAAVPVSLVAANYVPNDHHRRTFEIRYFDALFERLPAKSAIVMDKYPTNMMLNYKLFGEGAAAGRDIIMVPPNPERVAAAQKDGYRVFIFDQSRVELSKFDFRVKPLTLKTMPFPEYLEDTRDDFVVVVAATPVAAAGLRSNPAAWERIGAREHLFRRAGTPYGVIGVGGTRAAALETPEGSEANLSVAAGAQIGSTESVAPADIRLRADNQTAAIWIGGKERVRTKDGAAVAIVSPRGAVETFVLEATDGLRVPIDMSALPLFELTSASTCVDIGNLGWRDASTLPTEGRMSLRIDNYRPFLSRATFYVVGDRPANPAVVEGLGTGARTLTAQSFRVGDNALKRAMAADTLSLPINAADGSYVSRVELSANDNGDFNSALIALGVLPTQTLVRVTVDLNNPRRATVCSAAPGGS